MSDHFKYIREEPIRARLVNLRDAVTPILANNLLPHFTDHSVHHSDEMVNIIDKLIKPIQLNEDRRLSDRELQILYSSCYLHDIGMQYEQAGNTKVILQLGLDQPWVELQEDTRRTLLRKHHHKISAEMVKRSVNDPEPPIGVQLTEEDHACEIACLCEAHPLVKDSERYRKLVASEGAVRLDLLAALLRLADILEESRRRAPKTKERTLSLDLEAKVHWWRHYYTKEICITPTERVITLIFDFPSNVHAEYEKVVPELQFPIVDAELRSHDAVLARHDLYYTLESKCPDRPHSDAREMPSDVLGAMNRELRIRSEAEKERLQQLLESSAKRCKKLIQEIGDLDSSDGPSPSAEVMRGVFERAQELWREDGRRSAWILLESSYRKHASCLDKEERLRMAEALADMMVQNRAPDRAARVLAEVVGLAEDLPDPDPRKCSFLSLWARALAHLFKKEASDVYQQAAKLCLADDDREQLEAELAEFLMLQAEMTPAMYRVRGVLENAG